MNTKELYCGCFRMPQVYLNGAIVPVDGGRTVW